MFLNSYDKLKLSVFMLSITLLFSCSYLLTSKKASANSSLSQSKEVMLSTVSSRGNTSGYSLSKTKVKILSDESCTVKVKGLKKSEKLSVKVDNSDIIKASVSSDTVTLKGINAGKTKITVTIKKSYGIFTTKKKKLKIKATVSPEIVSIRPKNKKVTLGIGEKYKLKFSKKPFTSSEIPLFTCSDTSICTVSSKGVVTGITVGKVKVYAQTKSGKKISWIVRVKELD